MVLNACFISTHLILLNYSCHNMPQLLKGVGSGGSCPPQLLTRGAMPPQLFQTFLKRCGQSECFYNPILPHCFNHAKKSNLVIIDLKWVSELFFIHTRRLKRIEHHCCSDAIYYIVFEINWIIVVQVL